MFKLEIIISEDEKITFYNVDDWSLRGQFLKVVQFEDTENEEITILNEPFKRINIFKE